jgi:anti-anti-sigma regulatory factor
MVAPRSTDEQRGRREYLLNVTVAVMGGLATLATSISGVALLAFPYLVLPPLILAAVTAAFCLLAYWLGRRGYVVLAGYIPSLVIWGTVTVLLAAGGWGTLVPVGYVLCTTLATLLSGLPGGIAVGTLSLVSFVVATSVAGNLPGNLPNLLPLGGGPLTADLIILGTTLVAACILVYALDRQLARTSAHRLAEVQAYADELETIGRDREKLIQELQQTAEGHKQNAARLLQIIRTISVPVLPIAEGVIVMPLVGRLDPQRAELLIDDMLAGIATHQADYVLLDLTGMPEIDLDAAQSLVRTIQGAQMLGSECQLVGVQPAVAQALAEQDVNLSKIVTYRTLREGIAALLAQRTAHTLSA